MGLEQTTQENTGNNGKIKNNPRKGICPNHESCENYTTRAYDCNVERNMGFREGRFPCCSYQEERV